MFMRLVTMCVNVAAQNPNMFLMKAFSAVEKVPCVLYALIAQCSQQAGHLPREAFACLGNPSASV